MSRLRMVGAVGAAAFLLWQDSAGAQAPRTPIGLTFSKDVASRIAVMPVEPLDEAYNAAFREYQEQAVKAADLRRLCENITEERNRVSHIVETQAEQLRVCVARVTELQADIKTLEEGMKKIEAGKE